MPPIDVNDNDSSNDVIIVDHPSVTRDDAQAAIEVEVNIVFVNRVKEKIIDIRVMEVEQHPESVGIILWDYYLRDTDALKNLFTIGNCIHSLFPTPERTKEHERRLRIPTKQNAYQTVFKTLERYQLDYLSGMMLNPGKNRHNWIFTIDTKAPTTTMRMMHLGKLYKELHKSQRDPFSASRFRWKTPPTLGKAYIIQHRWQAVEFGLDKFRNMDTSDLSNHIQLLLQWQKEPKRGKERKGERKTKKRTKKAPPVVSGNKFRLQLSIPKHKIQKANRSRFVTARLPGYRCSHNCYCTGKRKQKGEKKGTGKGK